MKTKIAATLVALACVASIGFPAAADAASPDQLLTLSGIKAVALTPQELASTRGASALSNSRLKAGYVVKVTVNESESGFRGRSILSTNF